MANKVQQVRVQKVTDGPTRRVGGMLGLYTGTSLYKLTISLQWDTYIGQSPHLCKESGSQEDVQSQSS